MLQLRQQNIVDPCWVVNTALVYKNDDGIMRYESRDTGLTMNVDTRRRWTRSRDNDVFSNTLCTQYAHSQSLAIETAMLPGMPIFVHEMMNLQRKDGEAARVAMALNGLTLLNAWTKLHFTGLIFAGTDPHHKGDTPVVSVCQGGFLTCRNTGLYPIDVGDDVVYIPPMMWKKPSSERGPTYEPWDGEQQNGLFILQPMPLPQAVKFLLSIDVSLSHEILGKFGKRKRGPDALLPSVEEEKSEKKDKEREDEEEEEEKKGEKEEKEKEAKDHERMLREQQLEQVNDVDLLDEKNKADADATDEAKEKKEEKDTDPDAAPRPVGPTRHWNGRTYTERATELLMRDFYAGRCLQPGVRGALFVLQVRWG